MIKNENGQKQVLDENYIMTKIDEIIALNQNISSQLEIAATTDSKNFIASVCETNNKMIDFLRDIYFSIHPSEQEIIQKKVDKLGDSLTDTCTSPDAIDIVTDGLLNILNVYFKK